MKKLYILSLLTILLSVNLIAQSPKMINYQASVRDNEGNIIASQEISLRLSILTESADGPVVYTEIHNLMTTEQGIVNLQVGNGITYDSFDTINWSNGAHFLKVEIDIEGGSNYVPIGTSQFLSVPYALYASESGNANYALNAGRALYAETSGNNSSDCYWQRIDSSDMYFIDGKVGIGTKNPKSYLNLSGQIDNGDTRNMLQIFNTSESALSHAGIKIKAGNASGHSVLQDYSMTYTGSPAYDFAGFLNVANSNRGVMLHANSPQGVIKFYTGYNASMGAGMERMRIDPSGNVGIGTINPNRKLTIEGNVEDGDGRCFLLLKNYSSGPKASVSLNLRSFEDKGVGFVYANKNYVVGDLADFGMFTTNGRGFALIAYYGQIRFYTNRNSDDSYSEKMRINEEGNVGIGTTDPKTKLQITEGDIYISDINKGIIMTSPDGQCWRGTVNNSGQLEFSSITCP